MQIAKLLAAGDDEILDAMLDAKLRLEPELARPAAHLPAKELSQRSMRWIMGLLGQRDGAGAVSYTHLTLPTIYSV